MLATLGIIQSNEKFTGLLDTYSGAAAAYSLRKLRNGYNGSAIRVRRSSDNAEQDIGFDGNGNLDESALTTFVGANSGYVTKWYNQSGTINIVNTTSSTQPQIVNSGTIRKKGNKPTIFFLGTAHKLSTESNYSFSNIIDLFFVYESVGTGDSGENKNILQFQTGNPIYIGHGSFSSNTLAFYQGSWKTTTIDVSRKYFIGNIALLNTSGWVIGVNDSLTTNTATTTISTSYPMNLGYRNDANYSINGPVSELIIFSSDKSTDRTAIRNNLNSYYSVF